MTEITEPIARKCLEVVDAGLSIGLGEAVPGKMCVEAAICFALGLPHGDDPQCVSKAVRSLKIALNDKTWSSNEARAKGLRRLALAQLGSKGAVDDGAFAKRVAEMTIRKAVPYALWCAAKIQKDPRHQQALLDAANRCEREGTRAAATAAAYAKERDKVLGKFAEEVVQILIEMKAPGCQWLWMTEEE